MKKFLLLLAVLAGVASLNSCCGGSSAPATSSAPTYVAPSFK